jgi:hypothetical protein
MMKALALEHRLSDHAMHIDFLRLRCGMEGTFLRGIRDVRARNEADPIHPFIAFSEWDALIIVPCTQLYPPTLTNVYANLDVAASVSGTSGYFAYLWEHDVNKHWRETLSVLTQSGPAILMSLRFVDSFREDLGLGAEILFCNHLNTLLKEYPAIRAVVAHSLGWSDVMLLVHASDDAAQLIRLLKSIRLMTVADCIGEREDIAFSQPFDSPIFAASYSHMLGGLEAYVGDLLSFGTLATAFDSARLLLRVAPRHEEEVRDFLTNQGANIDSEMGRYSLSVDMSEMVAEDGSKAIRFVKATREFIGDLGELGRPDSYAETTSIFRFREKGIGRHRTHQPPSEDVKGDIARVEELLRTVPELLRERGASSMTSHRFVSLLTTMLDHLFDPVRSSVVRHLSRFAATIPNRIRELNLDGIDDLCHVLEYAVGQATDGIAQFQHDANALGLSGRGGYSRLIAAVEWYMRSALVDLGVAVKLPLITFGLRTGNAGSTGRYQIDIPFNVLFVPSRWHIILHEIGHLAWIHAFGWMMESLAIYTAMEREIRNEIQLEINASAKLRDRVIANPEEQVQVEFLRAREIVRELFPNYVIFALSCGGNIKEFDELSLRPIVTAAHPTSLSRELLVRVVRHCLFEIMQNALDHDKEKRQAVREIDRAAAAKESDDTRRAAMEEAAARQAESQRAATWWQIWETLRYESSDATDERLDSATGSIHDTLLRIEQESLKIDPRKQSRRERDPNRAVRLRPNLAAAMRILHTETFKLSVRETLHSVATVLSLRGKQFQSVDSDNLGPQQFGALLNNMDTARHVENDKDYEVWIGRPFAKWLQDGEVLTRHREAFDWSRLLLGSRAALLEGDASAFMRSQLSVLLAMWHTATTEGPRDYRELDQMLRDLNIIREMEPELVPEKQSGDLQELPG